MRVDLMKTMTVLGLYLIAIVAVASWERQAVSASPPLNVGEACQKGNPYFATTRIYLGQANHSSYRGLGAVVLLNDSLRDAEAYRYPNNPNQKLLAKVLDVGAVYGLAFDWKRNELYTSAAHYTYAGFGKGGPGHVYRIDIAKPMITGGLSLAAGGDHHDFQDPSSAIVEQSIQWIGKTSIGDIEIDRDATTLFVMNLFDRLIYTYSLPDLLPRNKFPVGGRDQGWRDDARPFGLGVYGGRLFHGVVDSAESQGPDGAPVGHIFMSHFDGSSMIEIMSFGFDYINQPKWISWAATWEEEEDVIVRRHPLISDIEFRPNGDLIIGLSSRQASHTYSIYNVGDVLATRRTGPWSWEIVSDQETYNDDLPVRYAGRTVEESNFGALARFPSLDRIVATGAFWTQYFGVGVAGMKWYDNLSGTLVGPMDGTEVVTTDLPTLGDIESLCAPDLQPSPTPMPTKTATESATPTLEPTPTLTPTIAITPSPSMTASPSPTATLRPRPIYLPITQSVWCVSVRKYTDVVLVIDVSTSMLRIAGEGQKLELALQAARNFVDQLSLVEDGLVHNLVHLKLDGAVEEASWGS